jgi:hypothetical protein
MMFNSKRTVLLAAVLFTLAAAAGCTGFFVNPTLSSLAIGPQNQTITATPVQTLQMSATGTYSDGSTKDLTGKVLWSSSTTSCAKISGSGLVTPAASVSGVCTTTISASFGTIAPATTIVTVSEGTPTSINLTVDILNPPPATNVHFTATGFFNGTQQPITTSVTWINSDTTDLTLTQGSGTGTILGSATSGNTITVQASFDGVNSNPVTLTIGP